MTPTQKPLRDLRERQSKERGRMAELSLVDELNDEQRGELDNLEKSTPVEATVASFNAACPAGPFSLMGLDGMTTDGLKPPKSN